jgi:hypothetical protein
VSVFNKFGQRLGESVRARVSLRVVELVLDRFGEFVKACEKLGDSARSRVCL